MSDELTFESDVMLSDKTGIFVRAKSRGGGYESVDIAQLDKPSLLKWLRSRGGDNPLAENVVGVMLGHGHLHEEIGPHVLKKP